MDDHSRINQHIWPITSKRINDIDNRNAEGLKIAFKVYWLLYIGDNIIYNINHLYYNTGNKIDDMGSGIAQYLQWLATGSTVWELNPGVGARFSAPVQTGSGDHPASYTMGTGSHFLR